MAVMAVDVDRPTAVRERLGAFASEVLAGAVNRPVQRANGEIYMRGLIEQGRASRWSRWSPGSAARPTTRACRTSSR